MSETLTRDIERGEDPRHPVRRLLRRVRAFIERHRWMRLAYRIAVGVLGGVVTVIGVILVPLPGPGWLVVFLGIAILGTEFPAAHRVSRWLKRVLQRVLAWWRGYRENRRERLLARAAATRDQRPL